MTDERIAEIEARMRRAGNTTWDFDTATGQELNWFIGTANELLTALRAGREKVVEAERIADQALAREKEWAVLSDAHRRRAEGAEARLERAEAALKCINRRASPNASRTFDVAIRDLELITDTARAALNGDPQ